MKVLFIIVSSILLVIGLVSMVTPIPGGSLLIAMGLTLLICVSETAARFVMACRSRVSFLNKAIVWVETHVPEKLSAGLRRTRPKTIEQTAVDR